MSGEHGLRRGLTNYGDRDFSLYLRRSFARSMGLSREMLDKPIVGIAMTPSGFNNCHRTMPELIEAVSRGVLAAGALPRPFPTISTGEVFLDPTSMVYRNLMSMDTEEMVRAQPMDAVVLIGGCDKTVPAQLMGAASANVPAIQLVTGPMSTGRHRGERLGACTDCRRFWAKYRAGGIDGEEIAAVEGRLAATAGTCAVMGTASTMAIIAEVLGMSLPGTAAIPAVSADRLVAAEETGKAAVELIAKPRLPSEVITEKSVENALRVLMAVSGSTNAVVHLAAIAGRRGIRIDARRLNEISDETPVLVDLKPVGRGYLEDFHHAGGVGALLCELEPLLHLDTVDVLGRSLEQRLAEPLEWVNRNVIRPFADPISRQGGLIALSGNLAPEGAIFKRAAASPELFEVEGRAVVFDDLEDLACRIDDDNLDIEAGDIMVLKNAGPVAAGMPEAGYLPIPKRLARAGVKDIVRISDARMSGTAFGTIVLHIAPEAARGGPLAAARTGDRIRLSVKEKRIDLLLDDAEIAQRLADFRPPSNPARGYRGLYARTVTQAPEGVDFEFLQHESLARWSGAGAWRRLRGLTTKSKPFFERKGTYPLVLGVDRDLPHRKRLVQYVLHHAFQDFKNPIALGLVEPFAQGHMETEVFEDVGVAPQEHLRILAGRQVRAATTCDVRWIEGGAKGLERPHAIGGETLQRRVLVRRQQGKETVQRTRNQSDVERGSGAGKSASGLDQFVEGLAVCQFERRFQSGVKTVVARRRGDLTQALGCDAVDRHRFDRYAGDVIAAEPATCEAFQCRVLWRHQIDGVALGHQAIRLPNRHTEVICGMSKVR